MEKISGGFLLILVGLIWLGPPIYWGYINGDYPAILVWSVALAILAVCTGWRNRKRSLIISFVYAAVFAAIGVVSAYSLGRAIALYW
jgi:hypothetical protein